MLSIATEVSLYQAQLDKFLDWVIQKAGSVLIALVCVWIGRYLIRWIMKLLKRSFDRIKVDPTVQSFLKSIIKISLNVVLFITAISILGVHVTTFVTLIGTAGVTIGLALQGSLSNFAGGVLILLLKPFVIGDYIKEDTRGNEGTVSSIDIFYTRLTTFDGKMVVIPNGILSNSSLTNFTKQKKRRLDLDIPIEYSADIKKVRLVIANVLNAETYVLQEDNKNIVLNGFEDSSMTMAIRVWVNTEDYWNAKWTVLEQIKEAFDQNGITIPFNQLDVKVTKEVIE